MGNARLFRIAAGLIAAALLALSPAAAQCTAADMKGDFATQPTGLLTAGPAAGLFGATGVLRFDGVGRFSGTTASSFNGVIIYPFSAEGSYRMTSDCKLSVFEETLRIAFEGYMTTSRNEVVLLLPQDSTISLNILRRTNVASCGPESVKGTWVIQSVGNNILTRGRFSQNGRIQFDGVGRVSGVTASSVEGAIVNNRISGTYRVLDGCGFIVQYQNEGGAAASWYAAPFDGFKQFLFIYSVNGLVITGQARQGIEF